MRNGMVELVEVTNLGKVRLGVANNEVRKYMK